MSTLLDEKVQLSFLPLFCKGETGLPAVSKPPPRQSHPFSRENDPLSTLRRVAPAPLLHTPSMPAPRKGGPTLPAAPISQTRNAGRVIPAHTLPTTARHTLPTTLDSSPRPPPLSPLARPDPCHHAEAPSLLLHRCSTWNSHTPHCNCIPSCHATLLLPAMPAIPEPWPPGQLSLPRLLALQVASRCKGHPGYPDPRQRVPCPRGLPVKIPP